MTAAPAPAPDPPPVSPSSTSTRRWSLSRLMTSRTLVVAQGSAQQHQGGSLEDGGLAGSVRSYEDVEPFIQLHFQLVPAAEIREAESPDEHRLALGSAVRWAHPGVRRYFIQGGHLSRCRFYLHHVSGHELAAPPLLGLAVDPDRPEADQQPSPLLRTRRGSRP